MLDLTDRVVVITGGAGGIGQALARAFREEGARVVLLDRDRAALEDAEDFGLACDVTDLSACVSAFEEVVERFGGIDVLVNNAGISHRSAFSDTDPDVIRRVMEVNFFGSMNCTHAALASVVERRGAIVAVSSVAGFAPLVGRTGYAASKHALHGFFDSLRAELHGTGTTVMVACPAYTATPIRGNALDARGRPIGDRAPPMRNELDPHDVAASIVSGVKRGKSTVRIGRVSRASWWLSRIAPRAYEAVMRRTQSATQEPVTARSRQPSIR